MSSTNHSSRSHAAGDSTSQQAPLTPEMQALVEELRIIVANPVVEAAYNDAVSGVTPYVDELGENIRNPWAATNIEYFVQYFTDWFTWLPTPTSGLGKIVPLTFFYLNNPRAFYFLNELQSKSALAKEYTREIFNWTVKFIKLRGVFMDSPESTAYMSVWLKALGKTIDDFNVPPGGFKSFNEFFARTLKLSENPRPIADPDDDSILVASADSEINFIQTDLTLTSKLPVKTRHIGVQDLLDGSDYAKYFVGGTAVSCVLMPNNYHHYHSPANGEIVEGKEVPGIYNGIIDGEHWFNQGNIGESTTEFSIFEDFHRAYFVIKTESYGYVAVVPVGLNTISAIHPSLVNHHSTYVPKGGKPVPVRKGDELGYFQYGGSLNILLFQPGVLGSVSLLMGQRLGQLSTPS